MTDLDIPIFAADMMRLLGIKHGNTLRVKIRDGVIPQPDVKLSQKSRYWHRATLVKAGLLPPPEQANQPSAAASSAALAGTQPGCT